MKIARLQQALKPENSFKEIKGYSLLSWKGRGRYIILCCCLITTLISCSRKISSDKIVTVTIEPQRYFAEAIAGDKYTVKSMVTAGLNPENYDPTPRQMVDLGKSEAYFQIGPLGFEQAWMDRIKQNNPDLKVFDLSEGFDFVTDVEEDHSKEHTHTHSHGGVDPHIWSSVSGAKQVAFNTLQAFIALDPENKEYYTQNYHALLKQIEQTEQILHQKLDTLQDRTFIIYHPALTYLAREFNLNQLSIELDGKEPSPAQLKELIETARNNQVQVVFVQQEFDKKNAELIVKETGSDLIPINPLSYDWNGEMILIANALAHGKTD
ncbi:metal ABC transporter solute-binding protein, Zn/Mn family [Parabacteroides pacaensis]|uniref:metal ABC transporter solute-binding protein, Zn/Mn family n=1 Tax=Parabacteroides pacaensis TaxID=2086575 RepID=UPI000D0E4AD6|nr:zinc ABC transporter substrate-binding protein [Parabacteroides pacaensis]